MRHIAPMHDESFQLLHRAGLSHLHLNERTKTGLKPAEKISHLSLLGVVGLMLKESDYLQQAVYKAYLLRDCGIPRIKATKYLRKAHVRH